MQNSRSDVSCHRELLLEISKHRKVSSKAISHHEDQKEKPIVNLNKDQRKLLGASCRESMETTSNQSCDINGKGYFIYHLTPSLNLRPYSVILVNIVVEFSVYSHHVAGAVSAFWGRSGWVEEDHGFFLPEYCCYWAFFCFRNFIMIRCVRHI